MRRWVAAVVVALVLVVPVFAEAACAWVLWNEETKSGAGWRGVKWTLREAAASHAECKRAEQAQIKLFTPPSGTWKLVASPDGRAPLLIGELGVTVHDPESMKQYSELQLRILCLPDTIDPRGQKGSGR